jgi:hypothetical protein
MGSCVLRETIPKGRPRFAPRVSLSLIVCVCLHTGARQRRGERGGRVLDARARLGASHSLNTMALTLAAAPLGVRDWRMLDAYPAQHIARRLAPSESITVDGRLDDDAWQKVPWTEGMVDIARHTDEQRDAVPADLQAHVKIRWDADYFYVGAELRENYVDAVLACATCWRRRLGGAAACCPRPPEAGSHLG